MLVHVVLFWLKHDLSDAQRTEFKAALNSLTQIKSAEAAYVGSPAATAQRPVVDTSYDYCLTVITKDVAAHDAYQIDPRHLAFLESFKPFWTQVKIYDAD
ncbi:MAG: hypothetical protein ACI81V_001329 [Lentimonas sp.]|jgi:hypothetical protein